jgi:hypothetical protein
MDLKDGDNHLGVHHSSQRFVYIQVRNRFYQFTKLMFGLQPAFLVFTKLEFVFSATEIIGSILIMKIFSWRLSLDTFQN